jgi:CheY-like chemotaxis protein
MVERDKSKEISTVITDYLMPRMNGAQLCRQLRQNYRHIKDVFLITASLNEAEKDCIKEFSRTFEKPLDFDTLVSAIGHRTTRL